MTEVIKDLISEMVAKRCSANDALNNLVTTHKLIIDYKCLVDCYTRELSCNQVIYDQAAKEYILAEQAYTKALNDAVDAVGNINVNSGA